MSTSDPHPRRTRTLRRRAVAVAAVLVAGAAVVMGLAAMNTEESTSREDEVPVRVTPPGGSAVLLAVGDIAECGDSDDEATAALLDDDPGATIAVLGDAAYPDGSSQDFSECYAESWGRYRSRTRPAVGNHEYETADAAPYYEYFGAAAGDPDEGYYSYDLGSWHVIVLNSECREIGGCDEGDPQHEWLLDDLSRSGARCTLAYWHRAPFSSGYHGLSNRVQPLWRALYEHGADLVLAAHDHDYERFAPMDADGDAASAGMRLIVVGTGGGRLRPFEDPPLPTTEARNDDTFGVLRLVLDPGRYAWEFLPVDGGDFTDSGRDTCR